MTIEWACPHCFKSLVAALIKSVFDSERKVKEKYIRWSEAAAATPAHPVTQFQLENLNERFLFDLRFVMDHGYG